MEEISPNNILKVSHISASYQEGKQRKTVLHDISFELHENEILGLVGESGCGKSTLSKVILGFIRPDEGEIISQVDHPQMIFQDPFSSLNPAKKISWILEEPLRMQKVPKEERKKRVLAMAERVGLSAEHLKRRPHELSGGMCQRVIIAMAVCGHPKLIIADEPTTALDVTVQAQVLELLKDLQKKLNTAILLITHNLGVVWEMCDTVMVMYAGNTVEYADTKTLYQEPLHPYTWGLLDSMPKLSSSAKEDLKTIPGTPPDLRLTGYCCNFYNRCPYATEICKNQVPPLKEVAPGHFVACHRQDGEHRLTRGEVNETCRKM